VQFVDYSRALRKRIAGHNHKIGRRIKTLIIAESHSLISNSDSWLFPPTESEYRDGINGTGKLLRLADEQQAEAQFYPGQIILAGMAGPY